MIFHGTWTSIAKTTYRFVIIRVGVRPDPLPPTSTGSAHGCCLWCLLPKLFKDFNSMSKFWLPSQPKENVLKCPCQKSIATDRFKKILVYIQVRQHLLMKHVVFIDLQVFAYCKGGSFNIHIWAWFGYSIC